MVFVNREGGVNGESGDHEEFYERGELYDEYEEGGEVYDDECVWPV